MGLLALATCVVPHDRPDLMADAKGLAKDRKVMRLLDTPTYAPFVCALEAYAVSGDHDPDQVALFSVSEVDYKPPPFPLDVLGADASAVDSARYVYENSDPTSWLRGTPNSGICMTSIIGKFRGPNMHMVGDGPSVVNAIALAHAALLDGQATTAIVVAYSPASEDEARTDAAAVVLAEGGGDELAVAADAESATSSRTAFGALQAFIETIERREVSANATSAIAPS